LDTEYQSELENPNPLPADCGSGDDSCQQIRSDPSGREFNRYGSCGLCHRPGQKDSGVIYYPLTNGRNIDEVLRLIDSLQTSDEHVCATLVNWNQGDQVIVPPPKTENEVVARLNSDHEKIDFYLMKREL